MFLLALLPASLAAEDSAAPVPKAPVPGAPVPEAPGAPPPVAGSQAEAAAAVPRMGVIFGGSFEGFEIVGPLEGAKTTRLAAHYEWDFGVRAFTRKTWEKRGLDWDRFFPMARELADRVAAKLRPKVIRDHRGIALYAVVADEDPFLTSAILSPRFLDNFREILGDRLHVVLLERNRLYVFPATGGSLADFAPSLVEEYREASLPVSLEILLVDRNGLRVIGEIDRDRAGPGIDEP